VAVGSQLLVLVGWCRGKGKEEAEGGGDKRRAKPGRSRVAVMRRADLQPREVANEKPPHLHHRPV
jgi:hypothetical protein